MLLFPVSYSSSGSRICNTQGQFSSSTTILFCAVHTDLLHIPLRNKVQGRSSKPATQEGRKQEESLACKRIQTMKIIKELQKQAQSIHFSHNHSFFFPVSAQIQTKEGDHSPSSHRVNLCHNKTLKTSFPFLSPFLLTRFVLLISGFLFLFSPNIKANQHFLW